MKQAGQGPDGVRDRGRWEVAAALIRDWRLGWAMVGGGGVYFLLSWLGLEIFPCAFKKVTGLPCPGCGMTRSCLAMVRGEWGEMWHWHPFGPLFALFWVVVGGGLLMPSGLRGRYADRVAWVERKTRWAVWVLAGLSIYSLTRWIGTV